jgi:hypothetical protein
MLSLTLQLWGGIFYLLNKIFFSLAERSDEAGKREWLIRSWWVYIIGLPPWVIILAWERNWMVAAVEAGGAPAMVLGLINAMRHADEKEPVWLDYIARIAAVAGISYSLYDFGGITTQTQLLELGVVAGFLVGTYQLAKKRMASGYIWFMVMNASNGLLMHVQSYPWLALQQALSLVFIIDAYLMQKRRKKLLVHAA